MSSDLFLSRFSKLNDGQKKAVTTTEGPVMVIAGPGTGKTETLGARISYILQEHSDIAPSSILCLTYTNAGVVAMRKRLLSFLGPVAHKVQIHTFHSFCNQIIQENPDIFPIKEAENISDLDTHELVDSLLDGLPAKHPLFKKNGHYYTKDLLALFATLKSENWTPEMVKTAVADYISDLPNREEYIYKVSRGAFKKGDLKQKDIDKEIESMQKLLSAVDLSVQYAQKMKERGAYDFNDMIQWVLSAFTTHDEILAKYQEQFLYILVDEFQDTNGSQKRLLDLLTSYWQTPNIFVVGDDDQSIYRFQGANMRNILDFSHQYAEDISLIVIDKNYRSSAPILALAEHCISANTERLTEAIPTLQKKLSAFNSRFENEDSPEPQLIAYQTPMHETLGILSALKKLQNAGENLAEVAVIYQNHKQVLDLQKACLAENIPVFVKQDINLLEIPLLQMFLEMLSYFSLEQKNPFSAEHILFRILYAPWFEIAPKDIHALALRRRTSETEVFFKTLIDQDENVFVWFSSVLNTLETKVQTVPLLSFIEDALNISGLMKYILSLPDAPFLLRVFSSFFSFCKDEVQANPDLTLAELLQRIERMKNHSLRLSLQKQIGGENGVHFITGHSSKGLEFEHVFLMGVEKKIWDTQKKKQGFSLPDTLTLANSGDFLEEKRRLYFVALTRAKKFLTISYSLKDENGTEKDPSVFIAETSQKITPTFPEYTEKMQEYGQKLFLSSLPEHQELLPQKEFLASLLQNYRMSATHLNKFLACGLAFYYETLLRIPSAKSASASFGSAIHSALEVFYKTPNANEQTLQMAFENSMQKNRFGFTQEEYARFLRHGNHVLSQYFSLRLLNREEQELKLEYAVSSVFENILLSGRLDKMEMITPKTVRVVDYKTGDPKYSAEKLLPPSEKNNFLGGDYWRQMVFYAILLQSSVKFPLELVEGVFDFVEFPNEPMKIVRVSFEDMKTVEDQIATAYSLIAAGSFVGCGKEGCEWCNR